jgi:hypothetical protein
MKSKYIEGGEIFCIPLFMPKDDWKLKIKLSEKDFDRDFAFGRVIETSSNVLVEIFNKISSAKINIDDIVKSGVMFSPILIFWDGILKKRWKIIGLTKNYNKFKHSNYGNLKMVFPDINDKFRLRDFSSETEIYISRSEVENKKYEGSQVWWPIDLENRILEKINMNKNNGVRPNCT